MPMCPICGGNIATNDRNCPYCGKTQLHLGAAPSNASEWDLPVDDNSAVVAPWAPVAQQPAPTPAAEDWLLPEAMLDPPAQPSGEISLPPWAPVSPPAQVTPPPAPFDFNIDLDSSSPGSPPPVQPIPVPVPVQAVHVQPPLRQQPAASANSPMPRPAVAPVPVTPVPVTPIPVTPVTPRPPASIASAPPAPAITRPVQPAPAPAPAPHMPPPQSAVTATGRVCPSCGKKFGPEYNDSFCLCGAELLETPPPSAPIRQPPLLKRAAPQRPPAGTHCLVLYDADKQPMHYFVLNKDAILVGRLDAASGCFPDIDVSEYVDDSTARKVSRKHALILRSRSSDSFTLRALPGNTGTQVEKRMVAGPEDVALTPGTRIVLGGVVRFKFEVM